MTNSGSLCLYFSHNSKFEFRSTALTLFRSDMPRLYIILAFLVKYVYSFMFSGEFYFCHRYVLFVKKSDFFYLFIFVSF